ncbi:flagellar filament capping protein FliD [Arthrobacter caoxuetaonis]|uniref:Flagellar hook-associated protein 2 n=1 Tax=Arthrobacter caoxuetaonis TaxID=2886935 RepID=A0A9X1SD45_9MICC|nr:flagellar filament capping protein FliD [Arthrobacter caoxuetaonis]MCC3298287.1 flagellar filament capping protein FliD [Arthrobacter caoxuetaonis]USQ57696.1 flagellar filament capping protein FliD [Arthrobacter caoxuetaonis]
MALGIDGLISGIDTTSMIKQLMDIEARPQVLLKNRVSSTQTFATALQNLNTKIASLAETAGKTAEPAGTDLFKASTTSDKVTTAITSGAAAGSLDISVSQTATAQVSLSAAMAAWPSNSVLAISANGTVTSFDTTDKSLDQVISEVNKANLGVTGVKIATGSVDGVQQYRVQFTAAKTGSEGAFTASLGGTDMDVLKTAQDAKLTLWAGTPAAQEITSSTNTFKALMPGVDITLAADTPANTALTINVARDDEAISKVASDLVAGLADVFAYINRNSAVTVSTSSGSTSASGGVFTSDAGIRDIKRQIMEAATSPLDGRSPSEIGIVITKDGTVEFDAEKFAAAMAADPTKTQAAIQTIAGRVEAAGKVASDKYDGLITQRITGQESTIRSLNTQIEDWDRRLASRESTLKMVWSNLEVKLSQLQSQQDWLTGQLASLSSSSSGKK